MSVQEKVREELKALGLTTLYFAVWFSVLAVLKELFLAEYTVGVLIVLLLEKALESRHEHGGFSRAPVQEFQHERFTMSGPTRLWSAVRCVDSTRSR
jgi:hypothetical protein